MQSLIFTLTLLSSSLVNLQAILTETKIAEAIEVPASSQAQEIPPLLKEIGRCESDNRQFKKDGTLVRGIVNPKDVGKYQINEYYHLKDSQKIGIDIYTEKGNTEYALHLFKTQGSKPWNASKHCWSPTQVE